MAELDAAGRIGPAAADEHARPQAALRPGGRRGGGRRPAVRRAGRHQARRPTAGRRRGARGRAVGRGLVPVLGGRVDPRQPGVLPGRGPAGPGGDHHKDAAQVAAARPGDGRACGRSGCGRRSTRRTGLPGAVAVQTVKDALAAHPDACGVFLGDPSYVGTTGDLAGHAACRARSRRAADRRPGLGRSPRLPPGSAGARDRGGRRRHGDQRAQDAARLHPGRGGAGQDRAAGPGPAGARVRRHPHHQPGRVHPGQHRRRPGAAGPGRRAAVRPPAAWPGRGPQAAA